MRDLQKCFQLCEFHCRTHTLLSSPKSALSAGAGALQAFDAPLIHHDIAEYTGLAGKAQARVFDAPWSTLTDQVLAFVAAHLAQPSEPGHDLHRAIRTFASPIAPDGPEVPVRADAIHHRLAFRGDNFDPQRFDADPWHTSIVPEPCYRPVFRGYGAADSTAGSLQNAPFGAAFTAGAAAPRATIRATSLHRLAKASGAPSASSASSTVMLSRKCRPK